MKNREHRYVDSRLSAYVDGEVTDRERKRIEAHLATCQACRADLRSLRWTKDVLQQTPVLEVPHSFVVRQVDVERQRPARRRFTLMATQWATAVVALLFVLVLGGDLLTGARIPVGRSGEALATEVMVVEKQVKVTEIVKEGDRLASGATPQEESVKEGAPMRMVVTATVEVELESEGAPEQVESMAQESPTPAAEIMMAQPEDEMAKETSEVETEMLPPAEPDETERENLGPKRPLPSPDKAEIPPPPPPTVTVEYGQRSGSTRLPWRIAEGVLGIAFVALCVLVIWMRRQR
jgi:anti-sigma factor RsiW